MKEIMTLIVSRWSPVTRQLEVVNRREVKVIKKGRWLIADRESFDPRSLRGTKTTNSGGYNYRLERH